MDTGRIIEAIIEMMMMMMMIMASYMTDIMAVSGKEEYHLSDRIAGHCYVIISYPPPFSLVKTSSYRNVTTQITVQNGV